MQFFEYILAGRQMLRINLSHDLVPVQIRAGADAG